MRLIVFLFFLLAILAEDKLRYLSGRFDRYSVEEIINKFTQLQPEKYRKVFQHYMIQQISTMRSQGQNESQVKRQVLKLVTDPKGPLLDLMTKYMRQRLFKKLEMESLTPTLQEQILKNPQHFYLTYDIYELLYD